jgi:RNA polymerase sigma factor (sigma-70 family)
MGTVNPRQTSQIAMAEFIGRLNRTYGLQLHRFLQRMLGRKELAEEVAQEAYLKIYRLVQAEDVLCPQALLFDVATKLAISRLRRAKTEAAHTSPSSEEAVEEVIDPTARPDQQVAAAQAMEKLAAIIEELPANLRQVFVMRYVKQMPRQEIALHLGISVGALEQRLTRALAQCRSELAAIGLDWLSLDLGHRELQQ